MTAERPAVRPSRVAATAATLVTLAVAGAVTIAAAEGVRLRPLLSMYVDADAIGMHEPESVACGADAVAIADAGNGRILRFASASGVLRAGTAISPPQVPFPIAVAIEPGGGLLAIDGRSRKIARLSPTGEFLGFLAPSDPAIGEIVPRALAIGPQGEVHVLDVGSRRILALAADGAVVRTIAVPADARFVSDIAVDANGDVFAVDSVARRVLAARSGEDVLAPITEPLSEDVDFPTAIAVDADHRLFVIDGHGSGIVFLGRDGSFRGRQLTMGWKEGYLRYPSDACVDSAGRLFVSERGNDRVQVFEIR